MALYRVSKPTVKVNNNTIAIIPNSVKWNEGEGDTTLSAVSTGGGGIELVISDNAEDKFGMVAFDIPNTPVGIELSRGWKKHPGENVVEIIWDGGSRVFNGCAITNNYDVEASTEGKISLEWHGEQPM